jgi:hypothetical protein
LYDPSGHIPAGVAAETGFLHRSFRRDEPGSHHPQALDPVLERQPTASGGARPRADRLGHNLDLSRYRPLGIEEAIERSLQNMGKLSDLLASRGFPLTIVVYPWAQQIAQNDRDRR